LCLRIIILYVIPQYIIIILCYNIRLWFDDTCVVWSGGKGTPTTNEYNIILWFEDVYTPCLKAGFHYYTLSRKSLAVIGWLWWLTTTLLPCCWDHGWTFYVHVNSGNPPSGSGEFEFMFWRCNVILFCRNSAHSCSKLESDVGCAETDAKLDRTFYFLDMSSRRFFFLKYLPTI